jgi:hypothetical protein
MWAMGLTKEAETLSMSMRKVTTVPMRKVTTVPMRKVTTVSADTSMRRVTWRRREREDEGIAKKMEKE